MKYKCQFPKCEYGTNIKSQINIHHIIPRERQGNHKKYNKVYLCPNCHTKIYIPESRKGIHTIKGPTSIILLDWKNAGSCRLLEYIDIDDKVKYYQERK